jgi:DNA-binding NarL/FixJ family response regulator
MKTPIRILLVDDHFMVRLGLAGCINDEPDMEVVGQASNAKEAIQLFRQLEPDVTVMDLNLPDGHGATVTSEILREFSKAHILVLSVNQAEEDIHRCVEAGALGFLSKSVTNLDLMDAIRTVNKGEEYFPLNIKNRIEIYEQREKLTPREFEVLELLVAGYANKEIADKLNIATRTVKLHVGHILSKMGVLDRTQAVTAAIQRGLIRL